jgi:hypothetical protein
MIVLWESTRFLIQRDIEERKNVVFTVPVKETELTPPKTSLSLIHLKGMEL